MGLPVRYSPDGKFELRVSDGNTRCGRVWPDGYFSAVNKVRYKWAEVSRGEALKALDEYRYIDLIRRRNHHRSMDSSTPPARMYGDRGVTSYGKRMIRAASAVLARIKAREKLSFATLTLPEMSEDDSRRVMANWGRIVQVYLQSIRRHFAKRGLEFRYVSVTEIQIKRFRKSTGSCLHLHLLFVGSRAGVWIITPAALRYYWKKSISSFVDGRYIFSNAENIKSVTGNAGGYLAKYLSKGPGSVEALRSRFPLCPVPAQWWSVSSEIRSLVRAATIEGENVGELLYSLVSKRDSDGVFSLASEIIVAESEGGLCLGVVGYLTRSGYDFVLGLV